MYPPTSPQQQWVSGFCEDHLKNLASLTCPLSASSRQKGRWPRPSARAFPSRLPDFPPCKYTRLPSIYTLSDSPDTLHFSKQIIIQKHIHILFTNNNIIFLKGCKNPFTHSANRYASTVWASEVISAPVATPRFICIKRPPAPVKITSQRISQGHTKSGKELRMKFCPVLYQQI